MTTDKIKSHTERFAPKTSLIDGKRNLIGLDMAELKEALAELELKPFRAKQIWSWMYCRGERDFSKMTNLSKEVQNKLAEKFVIWRPTITAAQKSEDGTSKWLLKMADNQEIECVHIPEEDRGALCISSQVGCTNTCRFCHTGTQRLVRNLDASEMVMQVMLARDEMGD